MIKRYPSQDLLYFLRSSVGELRQVEMEINIIQPAFSKRLEKKATELRHSIQHWGGKYAAQRLMEIYAYDLDRSLVDELYDTLKECGIVMQIPFDPTEELPF
jgi:hypothetical protein